VVVLEVELLQHCPLEVEVLGIYVSAWDFEALIFLAT
jgi:hypothetical protein